MSGIHVYRRNRKEELYTVGYWEPFREPGGELLEYRWVSLEDCNDEEDARRLVNYLNGGTGRPYPYHIEPRNHEQEQEDADACGDPAPDQEKMSA